MDCWQARKYGLHVDSNGIPFASTNTISHTVVDIAVSHIVADVISIAESYTIPDASTNYASFALAYTITDALSYTIAGHVYYYGADTLMYWREISRSKRSMHLLSWR